MVFGCPAFPDEQGVEASRTMLQPPQERRERQKITGELAKWRGPGRKYAKVEKAADGTQIIALTMAAPGQGLLIQRLESELYAGRTITVTCQAKGEGIDTSGSGSSGPVFVLRYNAGGKNEIVRPKVNIENTSEWQDLTLAAELPADATALSLAVGLRNTTGTVRFKGLAISGGAKGSADSTDETEKARGPFKREKEIFPYPKELILKEGLFSMRDGMRVCTPARGPGSLPAQVLVDEVRKRSNIGLTIDEKPVDPCIRLDIDESLERLEEYTLEVDRGGIKIRGKDQRGLYNGIYTLLQLIRDRHVTCCSIIDHADFEIRDFHIVLSNFQRMPDMVGKVLNAAARLKFNHVTVMMRSEVCWTSHPEAVLDPLRAFAKMDLKKSFDMARRMGLVITPEIQSLGHANWCEKEKNVFLEHGSKYSDMFENPKNPDPRMKAKHATFCTKSPKVKKLLKNIYSEAIDLCGEGEFVHAGMDEGHAHGWGQCCIKEDGGALLAEHIKDLNRYIRSQGRTMIVFHDMFLNKKDWPSYRPANATRGSEKAIDLIPKDVIIGVWCYLDLHDFPMVPYFREKGFQVIGFSWGTRMGTRESVMGMVRTLKKYDCIGFSQTTWAAFQENPWLIVFGAEAAWNSTEAQYRVKDVRLEVPAKAMLK